MDFILAIFLISSSVMVNFDNAALRAENTNLKIEKARKEQIIENYGKAEAEKREKRPQKLDYDRL